MRALPIVALLLLAGCGQSGDLYLPPPNPPPSEAAPPAAPDPPAEKQKEPK